MVEKAVNEASGGAFVIDLFDPGELVPTFAITDAVRDRKVEAGMTWLGYDQGKIPRLGPDCGRLACRPGPM